MWLFSKNRNSENSKTLYDLAIAARAVNTMIRHSVDSGLIDRIYCSDYEIEQLHVMRKILAEYFDRDILDFENPEWVFKQAVTGKENDNGKM